MISGDTKSRARGRRSRFGLKALVWVALLPSWAAWGDSFSFTALPADVAGPAGSTVGWGYTIANESTTSWLVLTALDAGVFDHGTPTSLFDFPSLAPGAIAGVSFDPANQVGLYELTWDATAPVGFVNTGLFTLQGEWWDGDPLAGGAFVSIAPEESAVYSATVTGSTSVPEPSSGAPLILFMTLMWFHRRRHRSYSLVHRDAIAGRTFPPGQFL